MLKPKKDNYMLRQTVHESREKRGETGRNRAAKPRDMSCRAAAPSSVSAGQRQTGMIYLHHMDTNRTV